MMKVMISFAATRVSRAACVGLAALALAIGIGRIGVRAQPTQPIFIQYDGFVRNKDGTLTLSFGYFNMNSVDVPIAAGADNTFAPAPGDRNQPIVFRKGRHRFACSMVVDKTFADALQWSVQFGGKTSTSTAKIFDPLYELELNSEKHATQGLDTASAPKNVCVNRPPSVTLAVSPFEAPKSEGVELPARVGQDLPLNASVEDDGLPRESKVTSRWRKIAGPGDVTFADAATASTRAKFAAPGAYELELSASDGEKTGALKISVKVASPSGD
jgi:hypothetical protein